VLSELSKKKPIEAHRCGLKRVVRMSLHHLFLYKQSPNSVKGLEFELNFFSITISLHV